MPTVGELQNMAEHVQYEIDEFRNSIEDLPGARQRPEWNRTLESVLLHFRVLRAFFFGEGTNPGSDVHAQHYITAWQPDRDPVFDRTKTALDKNLAHLTLERLTPTNWTEMEQMNAAIEKLVSTFKESLPPAQVSWFPRLGKRPDRVILGVASNRTDSGPR